MTDSSVQEGKLSRTPLRRIHVRSSTQLTGQINCSKFAAGHVGQSSTNERQFAMRAALDPRVEDCLAQPIKLAIRCADGSSGVAFPDYALLIDGRWELHEVKPDAEFDRDDVRERLRRTADAAERAGFPYSVALAGELRRSRDRAAIEDAWRRLGRRIHPITLAAVDRAFQSGPLTAGALLGTTSSHRTTMEDVHGMLADGRVRADMTTRADATMMLHHRSSNVWFERLIPLRDPRDARP